MWVCPRTTRSATPPSWSATCAGYSYFVENGRIPQGYSVWWGFEDEKLYQFAREDLTKLSKEDKPFAYIFFTADTHFPHGYADEKCPKLYFEKIHNSV